MKNTTSAFLDSPQSWVWGILSAVFALSLILSLGSLISRIFCGVQIQQTECYMVDRALLFFTGANLYPDPSQGGPYIFTAYPPLYFFLQALVLKATGGLWLAGRLLSFSSYLGCGFLLIAWGWNRWGKTRALATACVFWLSPTWKLWGSIVRPDTLSLLFHFSAFLLLYGDSMEMKSGKRKSGVLTLAGGFLSAAAVCIKQTTISLWFAYLLFALIRKEWGRLRVFVLGACLPVFLLVVWEQFKTNGYFLKHTTTWLDTGYDFTLLKYYFLHGFLKEAGWLLPAVVLILVFRPPGLLLRCQLLMAGIQLASLGRNGGAENYTLEFWLYAILLAAEGCWGGGEKDWEKLKWVKWAPPFFAMAGYLFLIPIPVVSAPPRETILEKMEAAKMYEAPGSYLCLDMDLLLMAGKRIEYQPVEFQYLFRKGRWEPRPLLNDIKMKKFNSVEIYDIPEQYLLPGIVVDEIKKNYHVSLREYGRLWLVPDR